MMIRLKMTAFALAGLFLPFSVNAGVTPIINKSGPIPFTIKVEIEGVTQGVFQTVEGLSSVSDVIDQGEDGMVGQVPGPLIGTRLVLKRSYDPSFSGLWHWRQSVIDGNPQKRDGHIFLFDARGRSVAHWIFHKGWPSRWEVPILKSSSEEPAVETIEIVHQGLTLVE